MGQLRELAEKLAVVKRAVTAAGNITILLATLITILVLYGCSDQDKKNKTVGTTQDGSAQAEGIEPVSVDDILQESTVSYDCESSTGMTADKRFWCQGLKAWRQSEFVDEGGEARDEFINAWKLGALDAQQARDPAMENLQARPIAAGGYESGYVSVLDASGIVEYDCTSGEESDNEYRDRWCEAYSAYGSARIGSLANGILRGIYINGYMSGRAIALTLPTSMESLFGGSDAAPPQESAKRAIDEPENNAPKSIKTFFRGFNDGFQAMIDTVRESVDQVMEQMQSMEGMPGMDGAAPPPGMTDPMPRQ